MSHGLAGHPRPPPAARPEQALKRHLAAISSSDITLKEVEGGYHELLFGPEKEQVRQWIMDWILAHAAAKAGAGAA